MYALYNITSAVTNREHKPEHSIDCFTFFEAGFGDD